MPFFRARICSAFCLLFSAQLLFAQNDYFFPDNVSFDPEIPSPEQFLGYGIGEWHTRHDRIVPYLQELAKASELAHFQLIGYTNERRPQVVLTITSTANHQRLEEIRENQLAIADPQKPVPDLARHPAIVLLGYNVHGNEPSGSEAAMLTAYYLVASQNEETANFLDNAVIMIDPSFNPDGRDRHSHWANMHKGKILSIDPLDREHNEVWPGGRTNHYWFDLNRDWLPLAQVESRNRMTFYHRWLPNVVTDYHEMGSNSTYFFEPTKPFGSENPLVPRSNYDGLNNLFAKYFSAALDEIGSLYFTKEVFDNSYPGYGSTYPDIHGGLGLVFEQASSRGHAQQTSTEVIRFPFTIRNHLRTSIATVRAAVENRQVLFDHQRTFFRDALRAGQEAEVKGYVFGDAEDSGRTRAFVNLLQKHQIKTYRLQDDLTVDRKTYPAESSYVVPTAQKQYRMIQTFFEPVTTFYDSVFYDASAWTVALAFGMPYHSLTNNIEAGPEVGTASLDGPEIPVAPAKYAYLFDWKDYFAPKALYYLLSKGLNASAAFKPLTARAAGGQVEFGYGSIMIPVADQHHGPEQIHRWVGEAANLAGIEIYAVDGGYSSRGIDLGSRYFQVIEEPKVVMLIGAGTSAYETGEIWHLLDTRFDMPVSKIEVNDFGRLRLSNYTVLVMASGGYADLDEEAVQKIRKWVSGGGTLILQRSAVSWAMNKNLIREKLTTPPKEEDKDERFDYITARERSGARRIGGSVYEADLDLTHPLGFGFSNRKINVYRNHNIFLQPSKSPFSTVVQYTDDPLLDGYVHRESLDQIKNSASLLVSPVGRGRAVCFVDNPNFRGFWYGTNKLFLNAVFFGPHIGVPR